MLLLLLLCLPMHVCVLLLPPAAVQCACCSRCGPAEVLGVG